jgi:hypothetical protein
MKILLYRYIFYSLLSLFFILFVLEKMYNVCVYMSIFEAMNRYTYPFTCIHVYFLFCSDVIECLHNLIITFHVIDTHDNGLNWYNRLISSLNVSHFPLRLEYSLYVLTLVYSIIWINKKRTRRWWWWWWRNTKNPAVTYLRCKV